MMGSNGGFRPRRMTSLGAALVARLLDGRGRRPDRPALFSASASARSWRSTSPRGAPAERRRRYGAGAVPALRGVPAQRHRSLAVVRCSPSPTGRKSLVFFLGRRRCGGARFHRRHSVRVPPTWCCSWVDRDLGAETATCSAWRRRCDAVVRTLLFWTLFTDAGAVWSVDARRAARPWIPAFPLRLLQLQLVLVYLVTAVVKLGSDDWRSGDVLFRVFQLEVMARPLGHRLLVSPSLCRALTWTHDGRRDRHPCALVYLPPARINRALAIAGSLALHAGIFLTMRVGLFCYLMIAKPADDAFFAAPSWFTAATPVEARGFLGHVTAASARGADGAGAGGAGAARFRRRRRCAPRSVPSACRSRWRAFAPQPAHFDPGDARNRALACSTAPRRRCVRRPPDGESRWFSDRWQLTRYALGHGPERDAAAPVRPLLCARAFRRGQIYSYSHDRPAHTPDEPPIVATPRRRRLQLRLPR